MRLIRLISLLPLAVLAGCYDPMISSGSQRCASGNQCAPGFVCSPCEQKCYGQRSIEPRDFDDCIKRCRE